MQELDFCTDRNGEDHHTSNYHLMRRKINKSLVVRRGQAFKLDLLLNRPYDPTRDAMSFIFYVAGRYTFAYSLKTTNSYFNSHIEEKNKQIVIALVSRELTGRWALHYVYETSYCQ